MRGGGGGAHPTAIVYEPELTVDLPPETTVGTAMNALAHCAEALYAQGHNPAADEDALTGAELISEWLPRVVAAPDGSARADGAAARRLSRRRGARGLDARARARDGAGGRRCLRTAARDAERHRPRAGAPVQRSDRP